MSSILLSCLAAAAAVDIGSTSYCSITDKDTDNEQLLVTGVSDWGKGCSLDDSVTWSFDNSLVIEFETRGCAEVTCTTPISGYQAAPFVPHWYFEPFRSSLSSSDRETPDLWWISRASDYGFGAYGGWSHAISGSGDGNSHDTSVASIPTEWHKWRIIFSTRENCVYLDDWTVDGVRVGFGEAASPSNAVSYCSAYGTTTYLGFAAHVGTFAYVRNFTKSIPSGCTASEDDAMCSCGISATNEEGDYCCDQICGKCGGSGCGGFVDDDDVLCCAGSILDAGVFCASPSDVGCIIRSPTARPTPRPTIVGYVMTDSNIRTAVEDWLDYFRHSYAEATYGHISTWETGGVTDMDYLFCGYGSNCNTAAASFNDDITAWDTSGVLHFKVPAQTKGFLGPLLR